MTRALRFSLLTLLVAGPIVARADEPVATLRVFYTGHSFHMFVPGRMAQMAKAADIKDYKQVGAQGLGGSRVQQHWDLPDEKNQAKKILEKAGADVFTMAPNVKMPDEGIDRFAELGLKHNPKIRLLVQESWVPGDYLDKRVTNNTQRDETDLAKLRSDQEKWRGQMEAQAKVINQKAGRAAVTIVPAGDAVVKLRELVAAGKAPGITKQSELFTDPIGHGKAPVTLLTSYCNFACITGRSPVGLKISEKGISDDLNALLQRIAWETVTAYPMSGVKAPEVTFSASLVVGVSATMDPRGPEEVEMPTYATYLKLDGLLALQQAGDEHDEMLFIIIHQSYELWFKEILHEIDYLQPLLEGGELARAGHTIKRVLTILKMLVAKVDILETMTPLEFLGFRQRLEAGSGFQSAQFREIEFALGHRGPRALHQFPPESSERARLESRYQAPALWDSFLAFLAGAGYAVPAELLHRDVTQPVEPSPALQKILVEIYRTDPPVAEFCERLVDLDEGVQEWRYRHVKMVERTIGTRPGTGGSSGAEYLRTTLLRPVFPDLWAIRTEF